MLFSTLQHTRHLHYKLTSAGQHALVMWHNLLVITGISQELYGQHELIAAQLKTKAPSQYTMHPSAL
jgi:hypothetical protein